jgi:TPR repeat protein
VGLAQDHTEARKWFEEAAALNDAGAMYQLGRIYENGPSVARNLDAAIDWYRKAANGGDEDAKQALIRLGAARSQ